MGKNISRWRIWLLAFCIWTLLGVFFTFETYLAQQFAINAKHDLASRATIASWVEILRLNLVEFYSWAVLAPLVFFLARRFPFAQRRWKLSLPIHILACFLIAIAETVVSVLLNEWLRTNTPKPMMSMSVLAFYFLARFHQNLLFYWMIL